MPFMWSAETFIPTEIITVAYNIMMMILISMFCYFVFPVFLFCATQDRFYGQLDTVLSRRVIF